MSQLRGQLQDVAAERDDWRDRNDARESERKALRMVMASRQGGAWWRRLIGGPVAELPTG